MADTPDSALEEEDTSDDKLREVFGRAIRRFDEAVLPQQSVRALALMARRFVGVPGAQWEGEYGEAYANSIKIEVDKVSRALDKLERDYRANRIVPDFRPAGDDSDQQTADTLDGIHRADSYHFKAQQGRDNAVIEAFAGGFGAYRLTNELADPYDKDSDAQRINPAMAIVDADQRVFFDPNAKLYDKSDARFAFVLTGLSKEAFEEDHDGAAVSWDDPAQRASQWDWFTPDVILVAEYYEVEDADERLYIFTHLLTREEERHWASDIDDDYRADMAAKGFTSRYRNQRRRRVRKYVMSGQEVLEDCGHIAGDCIPIVPIYYRRWYIDGVEYFEGYVQKKKDAQRMLNGKLSKLAEHDGLAPREIPIFAAEQMPANLAAMWARQNVDRHAYALVEPLRNEDGSIAAAGPIGKVEPPQLSPVTAALLQFSSGNLDEDVMDANEVKANTSAEAMDLAATRIDAKSAIPLDNVRQSTQREGEIYLSMARDVYWEAGRKVETMSEDGDDGQAVLQQPVNDNGAHRLRNDFTKGRYKVIASVTEATTTRRDKTAKALTNLAGQMIQLDPEGAKAAYGVAIMNMDGEGMSDLQAWNRKRLVESGVVPPNEEEKKAMAEAAQAVQPDPTALALTAQAKELETRAARNVAQIEETRSKTELNDAKAMETIASAAAKGIEAMRPANDIQPARPRIRFGRELA